LLHHEGFRVSDEGEMHEHWRNNHLPCNQCEDEIDSSVDSRRRGYFRTSEADQLWADAAFGEIRHGEVAGGV
jgi:hypothetical protein